MVFKGKERKDVFKMCNFYFNYKYKNKRDKNLKIFNYNKKILNKKNIFKDNKFICH